MLFKLQKKLCKKKGSESIYQQGSVKKLLKEFIGLSPLEKKISENIIQGRDKKALKLAKKKLGEIKRARSKRESVNYFLRTQQAGK